MTGGSGDQLDSPRESAMTEDRQSDVSIDNCPCDTCGDPMATLHCNQCLLGVCPECAKYCPHCGWVYC
eukprot:3518819-Karenia_brevis.AAC.1